MEATLQEALPSFGVVITTCAGREENLRRVVSHLGALSGIRPDYVVVVFDGCDPFRDVVDQLERAYGYAKTRTVKIGKHEPGYEQPRNVGFRYLPDSITHCWFLDSDLIFGPDILWRFKDVLVEGPDRILIGPYEWMSPGQTQPDTDLRNDPRWQSFNEFGPDVTLVHDLGASLACFSGNLVYPVERFKQVGGFHPDLHHGRCEDGELGLRAGAAGVPMTFVRDARAWHIHHPVDTPAILQKNTRDVPLINQFHPWVEGQGLLLTEKDGVRFDWKCPDCGEQVNSLEYWNHSAGHR